MASKRTYYLYILGCQMNAADAERLATLLKQCNYEPTTDPTTADFIGVVSCAVRQSAMDRIYSQAHKWNLIKEKRPLITLLTGCVLKQDKLKLKYKFDILLDMKDIQQLPQLLAERNEQLGDFIPSPSYLSVTPTYESQYKAFVPIMTGCNKFCTFCAVPYTRGPEISRPSAEIITEVKNLIAKGYKEIMLLGQNVNSYGNDLRVEQAMHFADGIKNSDTPGGELTFAELLHEINSLPGNFWLRFTTSHPYDMSDELIDVMAQGGHLVEYLNLPVQSGNNEILKKMNRHYTVEHYKERLARIREKIPRIGLSTDIIVGFCGETEKQFMDTAQLMEAVGYDMAFISQYSPRPGTGAARAYPDDISRTEKKRREKHLNTILANSALAYNKTFLQQHTTVLIDGIKKGKLYGKNREFKTVTIDADDQNLIGQFVDVFITDAGAWGLSGSLQ